MKGRIKELEAIHRLTADYYDKTARKYGLKFFHIKYLIEISEEPGRQQDSFVRRGNLNKSSITRHFAFLEENGFIHRKVDEKDRRVLRIFPTEKTLDAMPDFERAFEKWNSILTADLSKQEDETLKNLLLKIKQNAEAFLLSEEENETNP